MRGILLLVVASLASGCFSTRFGDGQYRCGEQEACPAGLTCQGGLCRFPGSGSGDGGPDAALDLAPSPDGEIVPDRSAAEPAAPDGMVGPDQPIGPPDVQPGVDPATDLTGDVGPLPDLPPDGVVDPPRNLLSNPSFDDGGSTGSIEPWYLNTFDPGRGSAGLDTEGSVDGPFAVRMVVETEDPDNWHVQLHQGGLALPAGKYTVAFWARADGSRAIDAAIQQDHDPYITYGFETYTLGMDWQLYSFVVSVDQDDVCFVAFNLAQATGVVWIDGVSLIETPGP